MALRYKSIFFSIMIFGQFNMFYCYLEIIPNRAELLQYDKSFITDPVFVVLHPSRNSPYVVNLGSKLLRPWSNNVTFQTVFYEKLGGTFKRSFVELSYKLCDLFKEDNVFYAALKQFNLKCPLVKEISLVNITYTNLKFNYNFPFNEAKAEATFYQTDTKRPILTAALYVTVKQTNKH